MRTLVEEHATAFAAPSRPPAAGAVIGFRAEPIRNRPLHPAQFAEFPAADEVAQLDVIRIRPLVKHRGKDQLLVSVRCDQPLAIRFLHRDGFLHEHMQTRFQRSNAE